MATVLVIAVDPSIEFLMAQLVAFAGHRPIFDPTMGAAGETIRRLRPDVVMLDVALPSQVVEACLAAADESGARPVLTSSVASSSELAAEANARHAFHFALPGGPRPLATVIERAVEERRLRTRIRLPPPRGDRTVHRALCAALAGVARARVIRMRMAQLRDDSRALRSEMRASLAAAQKSRDALHAAVTDYARQLKASQQPEERAVIEVRDAIRDCADLVGAEEAMQAVLAESEAWTRAAFRGASLSAAAAP